MVLVFFILIICSLLLGMTSIFKPISHFSSKKAKNSLFGHFFLIKCSNKGKSIHFLKDCDQTNIEKPTEKSQDLVLSSKVGKCNFALKRAKSASKMISTLKVTKKSIKLF